MSNKRSSESSPSFSAQTRAQTPKKPTPPVSPARLSQKSGSAYAFGGVTKVNHGNGTFSMKRTDDK